VIDTDEFDPKGTLMRYAIRFALLLGVVPALAGCSGSSTPPPGPQGAAKSDATVVTGPPVEKSIRRVIEEPATVLALEETPLHARIGGYVARMNVDMGDRIKGPHYEKGKLTEPGQVLAELSAPDRVAELEQKTALVKQAEAEVKQAEAALKAAAAHVETAAALVEEAEAARTRAQAVYDRWESEYKRVSGLVGRGVIDEQTRDETQNQFKAAAAGREEVEARVQSAKATTKESEAKRVKAVADLESARAKVDVAKAEEARVGALNEYMKIRAPFDGVVTSRNVHTGHRLTETGATPLLVVARTDFVRVTAEVAEADASLIDAGGGARIRFPALKDEEVKATVKRVSWSYDQKVRTLRAEVEIPTPKKVVPGMFAYIAFDIDLAPRQTLPLSAILTAGGESACFLVGKDNKAVRTPVKLGARDGERVQALQKQVKVKGEAGEQLRWEDFTGDEEVVLTNPGTLSDGQTIPSAKK
jgi:RND family efflux transporter MFP subunit